MAPTEHGMRRLRRGSGPASSGRSLCRCRGSTRTRSRYSGTAGSPESTAWPAPVSQRHLRMTGRSNGTCTRRESRCTHGGRRVAWQAIDRQAHQRGVLDRGDGKRSTITRSWRPHGVSPGKRLTGERTLLASEHPSSGTCNCVQPVLA